MEDNNINMEKLIPYWISTSDKDFETMLHLFESKDFHRTLFMGHLVIEKLLKACVTKQTLDHPPLSHDLRRLAKLSCVTFEEKHFDWLDTITTFNINARYDSYKQDFYKKCTLEYTQEWLENIKTLRLWIKQTL